MEPLATLGVLAGATRRVKLGTAVLVMPYRNPVLLARMLVTLDQFSAGLRPLRPWVAHSPSSRRGLPSRPGAT